jgi:hypothetical protein
LTFVAFDFTLLHCFSILPCHATLPPGAVKKSVVKSDIMVALKNVVEPLFIGAAFTIGTLINRRRRSSSRRGSSDVESSDFSKINSYYSPSLSSLSPWELITELLTRFFYTFPFLAEIWYWNLSYWVYQLARAASAVHISGDESVFLLARNHALSILNLEKALGIAIEQPWQAYLLANHPWIMPILAKVYYSHISVGVCFIIYTYYYLPAPLFQRIRRTIAMDNAFAFVIVSFWRCSPPRLLPAEYGYVDVLHSTLASSGNAWTHNRFQLTIAAMPSLHFGTALFFAVCMARFSPHRWLRYAAALWPAAMLLTIVSTANHFFADAAVGAMVPLLGWKYNQLILIFLPIQDKIVSMIKSLGAPSIRNRDAEPLLLFEKL